MIPIPPDLAARWAPMWADNHHKERPWWRRDSSPGDTDAYYYPRWIRVDDRSGPEIHKDRTGAGLADLDAAHPLPAPPPMPGQVWAFVDYFYSGHVFAPGEEVTVVTVVRGKAMAVVDRDGHPQILFHFGWPPPGAILVAGPTPWGRDVPWSPSRPQDAPSGGRSPSEPTR